MAKWLAHLGLAAVLCFVSSESKVAAFSSPLRILTPLAHDPAHLRVSLTRRLQGERFGRLRSCAKGGGGGKAALDKLVQLQRSNAMAGPFGSAGAFELTGKDAGVEAWLASASESNPTAAPGKWDSDDKAKQLAAGVWEVCYAPHISVMQQVLQTKFSPIRYTLITSKAGERRMFSNVRYDSAVFGQGWLSTDGAWESIDDQTVRIVWKKFWWDINKDIPSLTPKEDQAGWVQALGGIAFLPVFSTFPVRYLDDDTCAFDFAPTNSCIVARKVG